MEDHKMWLISDLLVLSQTAVRPLRSDTGDQCIAFIKPCLSTTLDQLLDCHPGRRTNVCSDNF